MTAINLQRLQKTERLTDAFRIFNELSENLAHSYQSLEGRIARLNDELAAVRNERINTLVEKEKLASRLQQILAALPAAVIILNNFNRVIDCNNHAIDFLGEPLLGQDWHAVMSRSLPAVSGSPRERQLKDGRRVNMIRNLLSGDGEQIILLTDVSELRSLQETLARQKQLSSMGEMVASLAHQVRTPLATAVLYASQMSKPSLAEEKRLQFSQKILERLHYLERQVNDMLIFAKQGRLAMQSFSLGCLLDLIAENMESAGVGLSIERHFQTDLLLGNQDALLGALMNLLNNAVEAGAGNMVLTAEQADDNHVRIVVADDGPGIEEHRQSRLFEPFFTTKSHGTGLGLAVVASVAKAHNGSIACFSKFGQGAAFVLTLPCGPDDGLTISIAGASIEQDIRHEAL